MFPAYIDTNLVGTGKVTQAAIIGLDDKNIWAKSSGLQVSLFFRPCQIQVGIVADHMRPLVTLIYAETCLRLSCTQIAPEELRRLAIAFNSDQAADVQGKGLVIGGTKYFTILIDENISIQLKQQVRPNSISPPKTLYFDYTSDSSSRRSMALVYTKRLERSLSVFMNRRSNRLNASASSVIWANTSKVWATKSPDHQEFRCRWIVD